MARKQIPENELRDIRVNLRLNEIEYLFLLEQSRKSGYPLTSYIRHVALNKKVKSIPELNREAYRQLVLAGNNLNQLTRAVHKGYTKIHAELQEIRLLIQEISRKLI